MKLNYFYPLILMILLASCAGEKTIDDQNVTVTTRITKDPSFLNPIKSSGSTEVIISQYLFLPLANYHPESLELIPVLLETIPEGKPITNGPYTGTLRFDCRIKEAAVWDDGVPITGYDYLFTIKTIRYKELKVNPSLRSVFRQMKSVVVDPDDPKSFSIYVNEDYLLARELALIAEMLPEHIYDKNLGLRQIDFMSMYEETNDLPNDTLQAFIDFFNHADCGRKTVSGSGPYSLEDWQTNQRVILTRKSVYWGKAFDENPYLMAYPRQLIFAVIPSDNSAITELRNGSIDMLYSIDGMNFSRLKQDEKMKGKLLYFSPAQLKLYFTGINNHSLYFNDKRTRKALAHLVDLDAFIENQENGLGVRIVGPIHPIRQYYNNTLQPIQLDVSLAEKLLNEAGWFDTNNNGILDKQIDGNKIELKPNMLITGRSREKNFALTLQEKAREVGMDIQIITKNSKVIKAEVANRNFDLYPTGINVGLYPEDLFPSWHSSNDYPGGRNRFGFVDEKADQLLEGIQTTRDSLELDSLYRQIQEVIYDEQPCLFMYAPTNNIIVNSRFEPLITVKKHGFFMNAFTTSSNR